MMMIMIEVTMRPDSMQVRHPLRRKERRTQRAVTCTETQEHDAVGASPS